MVSETCVEVIHRELRDGTDGLYLEEVERILAAIHPDLPAMSVEDVRRAIDAHTEEPYGYLVHGEYIPGDIFRAHLPFAGPADAVVPLWTRMQPALADVGVER